VVIPEASRTSGLIMLHDRRERNAPQVSVKHSVFKVRRRYFGAGAVAPAFGCLAMIKSLILS
jgi:hypothetical protein